MQINKHNLEIAKHCSTEPRGDWQTDALKVTGVSTVATNGQYLVAVTALSKGEPQQNYMSPADAANLAMLVGESNMPLDPLMYTSVATAHPFDEGPLFRKDDAPFEIFIDPAYLKAIAESAVEFGATTSVRIRFYEPKGAALFDARNGKGQKWGAAIMPRNPSGDAPTYRDGE